MDDQFLEKRLNSLKNAYEEMPVKNNTEQIVREVKKIDKSKRHIFHFPYVASFIGVGIITGILLMQFFAQDIAVPKDNSAAVEDQEAVSEIEIKQTFAKLLKYYDIKQADLKVKLGIIEDSSVKFASHIPSMLDTEMMQVLDDDIAANDLIELERKYKEIIDRDLIHPTELTNKIADAKTEEERDNLTASLVNVYDEFFYRYRDLVNIDYKADIMDMIRSSSLEQTIKLLNNGFAQSEASELGNFADGAKQIGYSFIEEDGYIAVKKDIHLLLAEVKPIISNDFYSYILLQEKERFNQNGTMTIGWMELAELLIQYEETYNSIENDWIIENMKREFSSLYALLLLGHTSKSIFDESDLLKNDVKAAYEWVIETHADTTTAQALKVEYEALKEIGFKKPADFSNTGILTPDFLQGRERPEQKGEKITDPILPLSDELLSIYKQFKSKQDDNLLRGYGPFEIMRLYFHADAEKDYETLYALYSTEFALPSEEQFIAEYSAGDSSTLIDRLRAYDYASLYHREDDPALITGVQLHYKGQNEKRVFGMTKTNGIWKVNFIPFQ